MSEMYTIETDQAHRLSLNYAIAKLQGVAVVWQGSEFTLFTKYPEDEQVLFDPADDKDFAHDNKIFVAYRGDGEYEAKDIQNKNGLSVMANSPEMAAARFYLLSNGVQSFEIGEDLFKADYPQPSRKFSP